MSLLEMQRVFCHVLTDATARQAYLTSPSTFLERFDLAPRERAALERINVPRLEIYSRMLVNSRIQLALKALPHGKGFLPGDFYARFGSRFAREHPPEVDQTISPMLREVTRLVAFIDRLVSDGELTHPQLPEALEYDATLFQLGNDVSVYTDVVAFESRVRARGGGVALHECVTRAPGAIVRTFTRGLIGSDGLPVAAGTGPPTPVVILFHRRSGNIRTHVHRINEPTRRFLDRCDGTHTLLDIAAIISDGSPATLDNCLGLARRLASHEVIGAI